MYSCFSLSRVVQNYKFKDSFSQFMNVNLNWSGQTYRELDLLAECITLVLKLQSVNIHLYGTFELWAEMHVCKILSSS